MKPSYTLMTLEITSNCIETLSRHSLSCEYSQFHVEKQPCGNLKFDGRRNPLMRRPHVPRGSAYWVVCTGVYHKITLDCVFSVFTAELFAILQNLIRHELKKCFTSVIFFVVFEQPACHGLEQMKHQFVRNYHFLIGNQHVQTRSSTFIEPFSRVRPSDERADTFVKKAAATGQRSKVTYSISCPYEGL